MLLTEHSYLIKQQATMLVVIDSGVEAPQSLASGVQPNAAVLLLDPHKDSIAQITTALAAGNYRSLHLVSHGTPGCLHLGDTSLNLENLPQYHQQLMEWGVTEILLYGCHVAAAPALLKQLHAMTRASIAASAQEVGQGNWTLEWQSGEITAELAFSEQLRQKYQGRFVVNFTESTFSTDDTPRGIALGDLDGDGDNDIVVSNDSTDTISVLLNNGSGSFSAFTTFSVGDRPREVAIRDFNGDMNPDVVVTNYDDGNVSVRLGNGSGSFGAETTFAMGNDPLGVAVGDFDNDGNADIITANVGSSNVSVRLGNGAGGFGSPGDVTNFAMGAGTADVIVADFNNDGNDDIATANFNADNVSVRLGNGSGSFGTETTFAMGDRPNGIAVGDFDGDGNPDIVTANYGDGNISVRLGNGSGGFGAETTYAAQTQTYDVAVGDFDGDGDTDIVASNLDSDTISVFLNNGSGAFAAQQTFSVGNAPRRVVAADLDGDFLNDDVAVPNTGNDNVSILISDAVADIADLSITKGDDTDPIVAGNNLTYTVTVENDGPDDATNVVVTDTLPPGVTFVSTSGAAEDPNGVPTASLGTIPAGGSDQYTIEVTVDPGTSGTITNNVSVTSDTIDPDTSNNSTTEDTTVNPGVADLSISKSDIPDPVIAGNSLTYTITVNNAGPATAENVVVTDTLPAGVSNAMTNGTAEDPNGVPTASLGDIPAGDSAQYTITVDVDADTTGTITNNASVTSDTTDPDTSNNSTTEDTTINTEADLSITKVDDTDPTVAGNNLIYTVTVNNNGPSDATNVVVTDILPPGVTFVSSNGAAEDPNGVPTASLGTIPAGGSDQYTITVAVDPDTTGTITNNASVTSDTTDPDTSNNSTTEDTTVNTEADLSITKVDDIDPIIAGNTLTYMVEVSNAGPSDATNVVVTDTLPAGVTFDSTSGANNDPNGVPTANLGDIPAGGSTLYSITVDVDADTLGTITNTAAVTSDTTDPDTSNNSTTEETVVNAAADLSITKVDDIDPIIAGNTLTYTVEVSNAGPSDATNVVVTDTLPAGVTFDSTTGANNDPNGVPTANLGTIAAGDSAQYTITVDVDADTLGTITNTATVASDATDPDTSNNSTTEETTVNAEADLSITKLDDLDPIAAGSTLTYTVEVFNAGPSDATNVVVTDTLPAGVTFVSTTGANNDPNGVPTANLGDIPAGGSAQYTITVDVDADTTGTITNTATVASDTTDPDASNNSITEETNVVVLDISLEKNGSFQDENGDKLAQVGENISYTFDIENTGDAVLNNVEVTDDMVTVDVGTFDGTLDPGETIQLSGTYEITQADIDAGVKDNLAVVTGESSAGQEVEDSDDHSEPLPQKPDINLIKTGTLNDDDGFPGVSLKDTITYTYVATNTGNVTLDNLTITDDVLGVIDLGAEDDVNGDGVAVLQPGASEIATATTTLTIFDIFVGSIKNLGKVSADDPSGKPVTDKDREKVPVPKPKLPIFSTIPISIPGFEPTSGAADLAIESNSNGLQLLPNEFPFAFFRAPLTNTVTVTNNGPNVSNGWSATDTLPEGVSVSSVDGDVIPIDNGDGTVTFFSNTELPVGQSTSFDFTMIIPENLPDNATVLDNRIALVGQNPDPNLDNNQDSDQIEVTEPPRGIDVGAPNTLEVNPEVPTILNAGDGADINTGEGLNLVIDNYFSNRVYTGSEVDVIETGSHNDTINTNGDDDYIDAGGGNDIVNAGLGDDDIRGGRGADVLTGGHGLDTFIIKGDPNSGAFGQKSDLHFDANDRVLVDFILDFNDHEDVLVLQDLRVSGVDSVSYHSDTGNITLTDTVNGEVVSSNVIAKLQPGLDLIAFDLGGGNWTVL